MPSTWRMASTTGPAGDHQAQQLDQVLRPAITTGSPATRCARPADPEAHRHCGCISCKTLWTPWTNGKKPASMRVCEPLATVDKARTN